MGISMLISKFCQFMLDYGFLDFFAKKIVSAEAGIWQILYISVVLAGLISAECVAAMAEV